MEIIKYSNNWNNKLFCDCWSTIRLSNANKYIIGDTYSHRIVNSKSQVVLVKPGKLIVIEEFRLDNLPNSFSLLDAGLLKEDYAKMIRTMYKNKNINFDTQWWAFMVFSSKHI